MELVGGECDNLERFKSAWQGRQTAGVATQGPRAVVRPICEGSPAKQLCRLELLQFSKAFCPFTAWLPAAYANAGYRQPYWKKTACLPRSRSSPCSPPSRF